MKSLWILFVLVCLVNTDLLAQKRKTFKIKPGERLIEHIPIEDMYSHQNFPQGVVYLKNGLQISARMSYNALFREMQFIGKTGDTLALGEEQNVKHIVIASDTFYYTEGFLKLVHDQGDVKLAKKKTIVFLNKEKLTGFGESTGGSIDTYSTYVNRSYLKELVAQEIITLGEEIIFYIGDKYNNFKPATKKNIVEFFSSRDKEVERFIRENKLNLSNEDDLKKLVKYFHN